MSISKYIPEELFRIFAETRVLRESRACVIVGGAIRDALRGIQSTDFDVEVYGVREEDLQEGLSGWGKVSEVFFGGGCVRRKHVPRGFVRKHISAFRRRAHSFIIYKS